MTRIQSPDGKSISSIDSRDVSLWTESGWTVLPDLPKVDTRTTDQIKGEKLNSLLQSNPLQSYQISDIQNPNYSYVSAGGTANGAILIPKDKLADFQSVGWSEAPRPGAVAETASFRPRGADETMSDYLVAKQSAGIGRVNFGTANNQPVSATNLSTIMKQANNRTLISQTPIAGYIKAYDTDQNYKEVYVPKGVYVPGVSASPKPGMTPETLGTANKINIPGGTGGTGMVGTGTSADSSAFVADYNARMAQEEAMKTPEQKQSDELTSQITTLIGQEAGNSAYTEEQLKTQVDPLVAQLTEIKNKIEALKVEQDKARLDSEGQPMTLARLYGENARQNALYNNQIDNLTAQGNALLGNIELAKTQVERAVNVKYGVIEEQITLKQAQLAALAPTLSRQETTQKEVLDAYYEKQKQAIEDKKTEEKTEKAVIIGYINDYKDAGITLTDTLAQAQAKLVKSKTYQKEIKGGSSTSSGNEWSPIPSTPTITPVTPTEKRTFEQYLDDKQAEAMQTFGPAKRDALKKEWDLTQKVSTPEASSADLSKYSYQVQQVIKGNMSAESILSGGTASERKSFASQLTDAENKGLIATSKENKLYSGLNATASSAIKSKVSSFKSEPIVSNFNVINEGYNTVKSISNTSKNPSDHQALIYAFAKIMDPNSVVRESEYATVQKYSQSLVSAYGKGVEQAINGTGILSEQAVKNMKKTLELKYQSSKSNYNNVYNQYISGINDISGRSDGSKYLVDYAKAFQTNPTSSGKTSTGVNYVIED